MHKMSKARTPYCVLCAEEPGPPKVEDRKHFLLSCPALSDIREDFLAQFVGLSAMLVNHMDVSNNFLVCLLDPFSSLVPEELRNSWASEETVYETSRNFVYAMHNKRTKILESQK